MRIPVELRNCTCFVCVEDGRAASGWWYGGTAFLIHVPFGPEDDAGLACVVTARHNLTRAEQIGQLHVRINSRAGGSVTVPIREQWFEPHEDSGADVAVCPLPDHGHDLDVTRVHRRLFVPEADVRAGDDVIVTGLFSARRGTDRNLPIVRQGIVAATPSEPFEDSESGRPYQAYLIECRSFGGLSGSPVFAMLPDAQDFAVSSTAGDFVPSSVRVYKSRTRIGLVGLIRGHFDFDADAGFRDLVERGEAIASNMGIAIVTPASDMEDMLLQTDFRAVLRQQAREYEAERQRSIDDPAPTTDP